jgi:TonB family protein
MFELVYYIKEIGSLSLDIVWFPLLIWTGCCALAFLFLQNREKLNPLFHYHLRTAALLSLPLGICISAMMNKISDWLASSNIETAFFVVQNPIKVVSLDSVSASEAILINWQEPSFFIGIGTLILAFISLLLLTRLFNNYLALKTLYKNLSLTELEELRAISTEHSSNVSVKLAFHDHPLVPFTFGWKQPVIVLPEILKDDPEKLSMALQHEMVHIKRGDYLLQLTLSVIESVFWFHPLIRYGNREIDTYREISCDHEVLSKTGVSIKSYANLLYDLIPLSTDNSKLSVSMAVKNSTLKKRIKTMKYHKLHKASFRQSIAFLMLMIVGITLPIACSDLRGPQGLSMEQIEAEAMKLTTADVLINGIEVINSEESGISEINAPGIGALTVSTKEYGHFIIALHQFEGSEQGGSLSGNKVDFTINQLNVEIISDSKILSSNESATVWVKHYPNWKSEENGLGSAISPSAPPPPRPPVPMEPEQITNEEVFVVVEQMPELIGGQAALQSKVEYPVMARRAGIEGRVTVQFIVNENGDVENAKVVRGIGGGANEEALKTVRQAKFTPGMQRGRPVPVQYSLSVNFRLENSDFRSSDSTPPPPPPEENN